MTTLEQLADRERLYGGLRCLLEHGQPDDVHLMAEILDWYRKEECYLYENTEPFEAIVLQAVSIEADYRQSEGLPRVRDKMDIERFHALTLSNFAFAAVTCARKKPERVVCEAYNMIREALYDETVNANRQPTSLRECCWV